MMSCNDPPKIASALAHYHLHEYLHQKDWPCRSPNSPRPRWVAKSASYDSLWKKCEVRAECVPLQQSIHVLQRKIGSITQAGCQQRVHQANRVNLIEPRILDLAETLASKEVQGVVISLAITLHNLTWRKHSTSSIYCNTSLWNQGTTNHVEMDVRLGTRCSRISDAVKAKIGLDLIDTKKNMQHEGLCIIPGYPVHDLHYEFAFWICKAKRKDRKWLRGW